MTLARNRLLTKDLPPLRQIGTIFLSFLVACLSFRWVERPFRAKGPKSFGQARALLLSSRGMVSWPGWQRQFC